MVRLYRKTRRILLPLIVCVFIITNYIVTTRDGGRGYTKDYIPAFKALLVRQKNASGDSIRMDLPTDGYAIAKRVVHQCQGRDNNSYGLKFARLNVMYETTLSDIQLCPVWKAGSTFLKRLFLMESRNEFKNVTSPFDISFLATYSPLNGFMSNLPSTKRFVFVRDPYKRLLSGYIDKLYAPNPVYWRIIGTRAIRLLRPRADTKSLTCGHDLTFNEYVKYVIVALTPGNTFKATPDIHFQEMTRLCKPCYAKYDFVGKLETFQADSFELLNKLNMSDMKEALRDKMEALSVDDAIRDTLSQPFDEVFINGFKGCISFTEALTRAWTKLQMRGLIGRQDLDLSTDHGVNITKDRIITLARNARQLSTATERRQLKKEHLNILYSEISTGDLEKIRTIYADDFQLFEYNDKPGYIYSTRANT